MPNTYFFAAPSDHEAVLTMVFDELKCRVLEAYSDIDKELKEFNSPADVLERSNPDRIINFSHHLMLWPIEASSRVERVRIELDSTRRRNLGVFRYALEGWGLISLQLYGPDRDILPNSSATHFSEKRALSMAPIREATIGPPCDWDWKEVSRTASKFGRRIRSMATDKFADRSILPGAKILIDAGITPR